VLLDEPLANLDYKLREELRVELPKIFAQTGAILIYATTEPQEALLLGGSTATLSEGRVTQFGNTIDVYNSPVDLPTAQTFSDPPFNTAPVNKNGRHLRFGELAFGELAPATGDVADGNYMAAIRPHHVSLNDSPVHRVKLQATVGTSEITGSETFIHVDTNGRRWVVPICFCLMTTSG